MYFIQWMDLWHTDCIWIVWVCEFGKLSYLSALISTEIYITFYYILLF